MIRKGPIANGFWVVDVTSAGEYEITLRRWPKQLNQSIEAVEARLKIAGAEVKQTLVDGAVAATFKVNLPAGQTQMQTWLTRPDGKQRGAYFAEVRLVD